MFFLRHNLSLISEIRLVSLQGLATEDAAILLPQSRISSPFVDYQAPTIGISTSCKPITSQCQFGVWGTDNAYSGFYCSSYFFGVLGKPAVLANDSSKTDDPDITPLASKLSPNLQIAFFEDDALETPYNTQAYNLTTGEVDSSIDIMSDDRLINEIWMAVAARIPISSLRSESQLGSDSSFFKGPSQVLDIVMNCRYQALDVSYTWFNSTIQGIDLNTFPNGTVSEIYHGYRTPTSVSGTNPTYLDILSQAAVQTNITGFCRMWANLFSVEAMSVIGGVTSPRSNVLQQSRTPLLVVKLWIPALVWLMSCCLLYPVVGVVLAILVVENSRDGSIHDAVKNLSITGLVGQAFLTYGEDTAAPTHESGVVEDDDIRVGFGDGFALRTWKTKAHSGVLLASC